MSYEVDDFNAEVIEASRNRPVLVDFWAPWCGPCRVLSPVLERLAEEAGEKWSLVTVNTDVHPDLSSSYGIRGIPAVKLFADGAVVAEFTGAMPEHAVKQWLEAQLPTESTKALVRARDLIASGRSGEAAALLEELESEPEARLLLASVVVLDDPDRALDLIADTAADNSRDLQLRGAVETIARLTTADSLEHLPEGPGKEVFMNAVDKLKTGDVRSAVTNITEVLLRDRYYGDDSARKLGVALFTLLGDEHPVTRELRRTFDMYLY